MNWISGSTILCCALLSAACGVPASETESLPGSAQSTYSVHYTITPLPDDSLIEVEMSVDQSRGQLRELSFDISSSQATDFDADGGLNFEQNRMRWTPGQNGGTLRWKSLVQHQRGDGGYDAWLDPNWGIFRAEDIIPRARTRVLSGARSETSMDFELPAGWSVVTEYSSLNARIEVANAERQFVQPRGWIAMGKLGIRRETIAGTRVAIAAPEGQSVRRMDMLALLNWTLPELNAILPDSLPRLTVVSAGNPMWRGGLSAPGSIYIHADRPLISENATSTLVHEVVHVAMGMAAEPGHDWIVEGIAEYYSLELLQRGGAITVRRYNRALERQIDWATQATELCVDSQSKGPVTALAVTVFRDLDQEMQRKSSGKIGLDTLIARISHRDEKIALPILRTEAEHLLDGPVETLRIENLPGCQENRAG